MKTSPALATDPQKGSVALLVALMLPVLIGTAAFAIDLAYVHVVQSEMQNDADAAALSGAHQLFNAGTGQLQWTQAAAQASQAIGLNRAAGQSMVSGQVQTGYWNLQGEPASLQPLPMTPGAWDAPAVSVTLRKASGQNNGPVQTFMARLWGVLGVPVQVTAVAAPTSPGSMQPGGLFPLAMTQCMYNNFWDNSVYPPVPKIDPATGKPYVFRIGSSYHYGPCTSGQWSSLLTDTNDVNSLRNLINKGNPDPLQIDQQVWIQPGVKSSLYNDVRNCSAAGDKTCEYVVIPTVQQVDTHALSPISGLACLHILDASNAEKYVLAEMSNKCSSSLAGGVGPQYGVLTPPSLVR